MIVLEAEPGAILPEAITVVIVEVAGVAFAVPSRLVERVTPPLAVTPLPLVPGFVDGLVGLGGDILPGPHFIWWNFVSSSRERIAAARADWVSGKFKRVEGDPEFIPAPDLSPL